MLLPITADADFIGLVSELRPTGGATPNIVVRYDEVTRRETLIGTTGLYGAQSLARDGSGTLYTVGRREQFGPQGLYTINPQTGAATFVAPVSGTVSGLAFSSSGTLYATGLGSLFTINPATGETASIGPHGFPPFPQRSMSGLTFSPDGVLYGVNIIIFDMGFPGFFHRIDTATGLATQISPVNEATFFSLEFRPEGRLFAGGYFGNQEFNVFAEIDPRTGMVIPGTLWRPSLGYAVGIEWIEGGATTVPEPMTLVLLGTGLAGVAAVARRRRMSKK